VSAAVIELAERVFRSMVGKRVTLEVGGKKITGKVLPGIRVPKDGPGLPRFCLRARESHYVLLSAAPRMRLAHDRKQRTR
jgi:hypothetical protein